MDHTGTGLGLSICKNIIETLGGTITVESEIDIGTSFIITIPTVFIPVSSYSVAQEEDFVSDNNYSTVVSRIPPETPVKVFFKVSFQ
jgi:hypothetical protein